MVDGGSRVSLGGGVRCLYDVAALPRGAARRVALLEGDVLTVRLPPVNLLLAMNFSYWVFKERGRLRQYFRRAHGALAPDGILYLDAYGGYEAFKVLKERTPYRGYIMSGNQVPDRRPQF